MPTKIKLTCHHCNSTFFKEKRQYTSWKIGNYKNYFCSQDCNSNFHSKKVKLTCAQCSAVCEKSQSDLKKSKSGNVFCSRSCAASYNNKHKTHGTRRSKLEAYLEECIKNEFPNLTLLCNDKTAINSELDFYFPDLRFAIELNGIFHYEPIYGKDKLDKIQSNDQQKVRLCEQSGIELAVIDSSSCKYLSKKNEEKYWSIVKVLVDQIKDRAE